MTKSEVRKNDEFRNPNFKPNRTSSLGLVIDSDFWFRTSGLFSINNGQHVIFTHNDQLFPIQLDFRSGIAGEDDLIALFH